MNQSHGRSPCLQLLTLIITISVVVILIPRVSCPPPPSSSSAAAESAASSSPTVPVPSFWTSMAVRMFELFDAKKVFHDIKQGKTTLATCNVCLFGMRLMQNFVANGRGREDFVNLVHSMCVSLEIETPSVCRGVVDLYSVSKLTPHMRTLID